MMKETWKKFRSWAIVLNCCILALGIVLIVWPDVSALAVCYILGVLCLAGGVCELVRYFRLGVAGLFFQFDLTLGIFSILAGVLLLLHPMGAAIFLPIAASLYIFIDSIFDIQVSVEMRRMGLKSWWLSMLLGILSTVFAFFLMLDPFDGASALMIFVGVSLMISSIESLYAIGCISKAVKSSRNDNIIDVNWTSL